MGYQITKAHGPLVPSLTTFTSFSDNTSVSTLTMGKTYPSTTILIKLEHFMKEKSGSFHKGFRTLVDKEDNKNV